MKLYETFKYIFPPRPELKISIDTLGKYDNNVFLAQPKLNGSNCSVYMNETETRIFNRHNGTFKIFKMDVSEFRKLYRGIGWMCLIGEYMNKAAKDSNGKNSFDHTFVIHDILVKDNQHLVKTTFEERIKLLDEMYGSFEHDDYLYNTVSSKIFRVRSFDNDFVERWKKIVTIDMLEGFVLKRKDGQLEDGVREKNTTSCQLKCRKETKNYSF